MSSPLRECVRRSLLGLVNEFEEIRSLGFAFDKEVHMVRHVAVGKDCHVALGCSVQNLLEDEIDDGVFGEEPLSLVGAEGEETTLQTDIQRRVQARSFSVHVAREVQGPTRLAAVFARRSRQP